MLNEQPHDLHRLNGRAKPVAKHLHHRAGTAQSKNAAPKTFRERLVARRLELEMTQQDVANEVIFTYHTGKSAGEEQRLSRSALCTYELGATEPSLSNIEALAKALKVSPEWLAFGRGQRHNVVEYAYDAGEHAFRPQAEWVLSDDWLEGTLGLSADKIGLFVVSEYVDRHFAPGDVAVVSQGTEPTASGGLFLYATSKDGPKIARVARLPRTNSYRIFTGDNTFQEVPPNKIKILGRLISKLGNFTTDHG